jgi:hypothetical protein
LRTPPLGELRALDDRIREALASGDESGLDILGYGEISTVVRLETGDGGYACKRMPPLPSRQRFEEYRALFERYVERLRQHGTEVVETAMVGLETDGAIAAYCVQPLLPADTLLPNWLRDATPEAALALFERVLERVRSTVGPELGLDGQLSNWAVVGDELRYLDLTTPMLRAPDGRELLDTEVHLASLPYLFRGVVRRFVVKDILDKYYQPRAVVLDALANLHKERLTELLPSFVEAASAVFSPPFSLAEAGRYYRSDARLWELLLRARRLDRAWQRRVRRRPYPFLLPGPIRR